MRFNKAAHRYGLMLIHTSLILSIVAMAIGRFVTGYASGILIHQGLFVTCMAQSSYGSVYTCQSPAFWYSFNMGDLDRKWYAFGAFMVADVFVRGVSLILMSRRRYIQKRWPIGVIMLRTGLIIGMILSVLCGTIALGLATTAPEQFASRWRSPWMMDSSMHLQIVSYPLSVIGFILYCVGWRHEVNNLGTRGEGEGSSLSSSLLYDSNQSTTMQPQQVSLNINGQTVMATISPQNVHSGTTNYVPPAQNVQSPTPVDQYVPVAQYGQQYAVNTNVPTYNPNMQQAQPYVVSYPVSYKQEP